MALSDEVKRLARDAVADISNSYQLVLMQNTGWARPGDLSRDRSRNTIEEISKQELPVDRDPPRPDIDLA
jgi:hypothetical protein